MQTLFSIYTESNPAFDWENWKMPNTTNTTLCQKRPWWCSVKQTQLTSNKRMEKWSKMKIE